ncbi:DUF21 domain-containing protein [Pyrus ussuriensis x Pyrus communis]|uniref:DUF21 domain-containing protein n=1 Tax=Pyrus ussuriensis x Pyrus communis TaxID=2448454 RepID=A0A5N5F3C1_9ROSA|nr:DUF21 domain-containing protein [Pyrus ussuriensis x Pyrus communis]
MISIDLYKSTTKLHTHLPSKALGGLEEDTKISGAGSGGASRACVRDEATESVDCRLRKEEKLNGGRLGICGR